jgi:hypothetical protein
MVRRTGGSGWNPNPVKELIWKLPDSRPEPHDGYLTVVFPHHSIRLPSASEFLVPTMTKRHAPLSLSPRGGTRFPFDAGLIKPTMPPRIRDRMYQKIIEDALRERRRPEPRPAIKAPPKGDGEKKARPFGGVMMGAGIKKTAPEFGSPLRSMTISALAMRSNTALIAPLAIALSASAFMMI